jgi:hypothetical protein
MNRLRCRFSRAARAWLACLALQLAAVPAAEATARPDVTLCAAVEYAPTRKLARAAVGRDAPLPIDDAPRATAAVAQAVLPAPNTCAARVLVPRLYLRLLSIRC